MALFVTRRLALPLAVLAFVAACGSGAPATGGGGGSTTAPTTAPTPAQGGDGGELGGRICQALPVAEVQPFLPKTIAKTTPDEDGCNWEGSGEGIDDIWSVEVRLEPSGGTGSMDAMRLAFPKGKTVSGLADDAYWAEIGVLAARRGACVVTTQLVFVFKGEDEDPKSQDAAEKITRKAFERNVC